MPVDYSSVLSDISDTLVDISSHTQLICAILLIAIAFYVAYRVCLMFYRFINKFFV